MPNVHDRGWRYGDLDEEVPMLASGQDGGVVIETCAVGLDCRIICEEGACIVE